MRSCALLLSLCLLNPTPSPPRSDDGDNGHGPPLRPSVVRPQASAAASHDAAAAASTPNNSAIAATADDGDEATRGSFSAAIDANVSRASVIQDSRASVGGADDEVESFTGFGSMVTSGIFTEAADDAIAGVQSPILKAGWLLKLARFGRDHKRCVAIHSRLPFCLCSVSICG